MADHRDAWVALANGNLVRPVEDEDDRGLAETRTVMIDGVRHLVAKDAAQAADLDEMHEFTQLIDSGFFD